ncbi:hypothetical protein AB5J49_44400 [Streptomyces sp. R28]|uniref:Uncharacterized protein n=1 Tax=Streptomyces sp. R28 TaxID=3238628 RepID=A0AB39QFM3_9ACTN
MGQSDELGKQATGADQVLVLAVLDDSTFVHDEDAVGEAGVL